ncbi:MAG TPA: vitamin K epoxide reductase family protein [Anaerolineales bacterium]
MIRQKRFTGLLLVLTIITLTICLYSPALAQEQVVRAVLFLAPSCPHCHKVINEDLPPIVEKYQQKLEILGVNTATEGGQALFQSAIQKFNIPPEQQGVPMLIAGDVVLVGSVDIPEKFPGLIEAFLSQGGVDWPEIPGLAEAMAEVESQASPTAEGTSPGSTPQGPKQPAGEETATETPQPSSTQTNLPSAPTSTPSGLILSDEPPPGVWARVSRDPAGNSLAILVLAGMLVSVVRSVDLLRPTNHLNEERKWTWMIPVLCFVGLAVAGYLSYVETTQSTAICGPVGDCNTVQQSPYAHLFGELPIGILGLVGYVAILVAWTISRFNHERLADLASLGLLVMTFLGTLFSIYLTFLEPFVIGATCAWCLGSAVIMTALLWLSIPAAKSALVNLNQR